MLQAEKEIVAQDYETAIIIDTDGNEILRKDGGKGEVSFTKDEIVKLEGCTLTHNHPSGASFSDEDVQAVVKLKLAEIRVVGFHGATRYRYTLRPAQKIEGLVRGAFNNVARQVELGIYRRFFGAVNTGKMSVKEANEQHYHELWQATNDRLLAQYNIDIGYSREVW